MIALDRKVLRDVAFNLRALLLTLFLAKSVYFTGVRVFTLSFEFHFGPHEDCIQ